LFAAVWTVCVAYPVAGQEALESEPAERAFATMSTRWGELRAYELVDGSEIEVEPVPEPIFQFFETARERSYGTVWVWGAKGRPLALLAQGRDHEQPLSCYELAALSDRVSVEMHDGWRWSPGQATSEMTPFANGPPPAGRGTVRLSQIKSLARRFTISEALGDEVLELRLLPTPIHRYEDDAAGLIDGALFSFAHGTNPEALVIIECQTRDGESFWSYGFVPLGAAGLTARLDDQVVWKKDSTPGPKRQDPYSTWLESDP
jgi:hypothetical protein